MVEAVHATRNTEQGGEKDWGDGVEKIIVCMHYGLCEVSFFGIGLD